MSQTLTIAKNYSKALFSAAKSQNLVEESGQSLDKFCHALKREFASELLNPAISKKNLVDIVTKFLEKLEINSLVSNFIKLVAQNRRMSYIKEISQEFTKLVKQEGNIIEVQIISTQSLSQENLLQIKNILAKKYEDKIIEINLELKKDILGGFQVKIGSDLIDNSLKNQLRNMQNDLMKEI